MTLGGSEPPDPEQAERQAIARRLLELFPETRTQILDTENSYEVAGAVALHVRDLVRRGVGAEDHRVQKLFALLNELAGRPSKNAQELAAWGVMEVLQDFREVDPVAAELLDEAGKGLWADVERFWHGASPRP